MMQELKEFYVLFPHFLRTTCSCGIQDQITDIKSERESEKERVRSFLLALGCSAEKD